MKARNPYLRVLLPAAALIAAAAVVVLLRPRPPESIEVAIREEAAPLERMERPEIPATERGNLRSDLAEALGQGEKVAGRQRLDTLRALGGKLEDLDAKILIDELLRTVEPGVEAGWYAEYFHEICRVLQGQEAHREMFARALATVAVDRSRDQTIRDYALQHLGTAWAASVGDESLRDSVQATFREVMAGDPELAPAALLSLHLLGSDFDGQASARGETGAYALPDPELSPLVAGLLEEPAATSTAVGGRMAALRIVADRRMAEFLPQVRQIAAAEGSEHPVARMAAIAALGRFAEAEDLPLLQSLDTKDPRIAGAVGNALKHFPEP